MACLEKMETHKSAEWAEGSERKASFNATPSHTLLYLPSRWPDSRRPQQNRQVGNSAVFPSAVFLGQQRGGQGAGRPCWKVPGAPPPASRSDPGDLALRSASPEPSEGSTELPISSDHVPLPKAITAQSLATDTAKLCSAGKRGEKFVSI